MSWKKIMIWLRSRFTKAKVVDSSTITKKLFSHVIFVNHKGVLCFQGKNITAEITGVSEWPDEIKAACKVDLSTTVVDIVINPYKIQ